MPLSQGDTAPDLSALDQFGKTHSLADYRGSWLLLYFYPKDNTPGCTAEACSFRDTYSTLTAKLKIVGVSTDSVASHQKFSQKFTLPFPLLADTDKTIVKAYQVWAPKKFMGLEFLGTLRVSFLIDPDGKIAKIFPKVNPKTNAQEILAVLDNL
jgi:thioredoxin-dependent peroxiredoxin